MFAPSPFPEHVWPGGHYLANVYDTAHVRAGVGCVFASMSNSATRDRVSVELTPGEALAYAEELVRAARIAIAAEHLCPPDNVLVSSSPLLLTETSP